MRQDTKVHVGLAVITVILLWSTSLSACRQLAFYIISSSDIVPVPNDQIANGTESQLSQEVTAPSNQTPFEAASLRLVAVLLEESSRFKDCADRQHENCLMQVQDNADWAMEVFEGQLVQLNEAAQSVHRHLDACSLQMDIACLSQANQSNAQDQRQLQVQQLQARQQLNQLQTASQRQVLARDAFWSAVECAKPGGNCTKRTLSDQFTDALQLWMDIHNFDLQQAATYSARAKQRIDQAESFIASIRAVTDNLLAIGINLGIPNPEPPLPDLYMAGVPNLPSVQQMFDSALKEKLADVNTKEQLAEASLQNATKTQQDQVKQLSANAANATSATGASVESRVNDTAQTIARSISTPGMVSFMGMNASMILERLQVLEAVWREIRDMSDVAVRLDLLYRAAKSLKILVKAFRTTKRDPNFFYDGTEVLDAKTSISRASKGIGFLRIIRKEISMTFLLGTILIGSFSALVIDNIYLPLWQDFKQGCSLTPSEASSSTTSEAIARNVAQIAERWSAMPGETLQQHHALEIQAIATQTCMNYTFTTNERVHQLDKQVRYHFAQLQSKDQCGAANSTSCDTNVTWTAPNGPSYDCSGLLSQCEVSCIGPSQELIQSRSRDFTCFVQGQFYRSIRQTLVALTIFTSVNLARIALVRGFLKLWQAARMRQGNHEEDVRPIVWRCDAATGRLSGLSRNAGAPLADEETKLKEFFALKDKQNVRLGWMYITASAVMHFVWIIIVHSNFM